MVNQAGGQAKFLPILLWVGPTLGLVGEQVERHHHVQEQYPANRDLQAHSICGHVKPSITSMQEFTIVDQGSAIFEAASEIQNQAR